MEPGDLDKYLCAGQHLITAVAIVVGGRWALYTFGDNAHFKGRTWQLRNPGAQLNGPNWTPESLDHHARSRWLANPAGNARRSER
jgi:hypothetical protein